MAEAGDRLTAVRRDVLARLQASQVEGAFPVAELELDPGEGAEDLAQALAEGRSRERVAGRSLAGRAARGSHFSGMRPRGLKRNTTSSSSPMVSSRIWAELSARCFFNQ